MPVRIDFKWADQGSYVLGRAGPNAIIPKGAKTDGEGHALSMLVGTMGTYAVNTAYLLPCAF